MAMIKTLKFVNGIPKELNPEVDSLIVKSIKIGGNAGTELTVELVNALTGGGDASANHNHDTLYYTKAQVDAAIQAANDSGGGAVAAEQSAREAADADLQDQINTEVSRAQTAEGTLQSNIDAEASARTQGDADTLASAQAYTDAAEQRIMGGIAPETLDTIAEIAAALESEESATGQILQKQGEFETRINDLEIEMPNKASQADLSQEVTDRTNADAFIQGQVDSLSSSLGTETTDRQNADAYLQSQIDAITSDGSDAAAIQAEQDARIAADNDLQGQINTESSRAQAAESTLQSNINSEATARQNADADLQAAIDNEIARATAAEAAESDARQVGDTLLEDALNVEKARITQEISDRQAAVSAEQSARESADTTLTNNLNSEISRAQAAEATKLNKSGDTMTGALNMGSNKITNVAAGASGSTEAVNVAQLEAAIANVSSGGSSDLANETAARQAADADLQSQITSLATNIAWKGAVFAVTSDTNVAIAEGAELSTLLPFSDDEGTQLVLADFSAGKYILQSNGASSALFKIIDDAGVLKLAAPETALAADQGFIVKHDLIDSPAAQEGRSIYHFDGSQLQKLGDFDFAFASGIDISAAFDDSVDNGYILAGDSVEQALAKLQRKLKDEISRAQAAEAANAQAIMDEQNRATLAESNLNSAILAEESRAQGEESRIEGKIDQEVSDRQSAILSEQTARQNADTTLQSNIDVVSTSLSDEVSNRINADTLLDGRIDTEISDRQNADAYLQSQIDAIQADGSSAAALQAEEDARIAADNTLQSNIDAEQAARESADNTLQTNIAAEETARIAADNALQTSVNSKVQRTVVAGLSFQVESPLVYGDVVCRVIDAGTVKYAKASAAAADNVDHNSGTSRWEVVGAAESANASDATIAFFSHQMHMLFDGPTTASDLGKAVYLSVTAGKVTLGNPPTDAGASIVYVGRLVNHGSGANQGTVHFAGCQLRGVNSEA